MKRPISRAVRAAGPLLILVALLTSGLSVARSGDDDTRKAPSIETIKALAGDWYKLNEEGEVTDELVSSYRVTAGGTAVLEYVYPGQEHEMLTVYHEDAGRLLLTHYCMLGNAPTYEAKNGPGEGELVYECMGGSNMKESDKHMHRGQLVFSDADHYSSTWTMMEAGEVAMTVEANVARRKK